MFLSITFSSYFLCLLVLQETGGIIYKTAWRRTLEQQSEGASSPAALFPFLHKTFRPLTPHIRAIIIKDIRTFFRDPLQWTQAVVFFGILAIYFLNLRSFKYNLLPDEWRNVIVLLNVFSVASVTCSLGARFIYPQLSMEGQAFWTIGLSPVKPGTIILTKLVISIAALLPIGVVLMLISSLMLDAGLLST